MDTQRLQQMQADLEKLRATSGGTSTMPTKTGNIQADLEAFRAYQGQQGIPKSTKQPKAPLVNRIGDVAGNIFGGKQIGESIGQGIRRKRFENSEEGKVLKEKVGEEAYQKILEDVYKKPTSEQVVGDIGRVALNFAPVGKIAGNIKSGATALGAGAKLAKPIAQIGTGAGIGYGADVTTKLAEGQEDPFKAGIGTAIGTGIGALPIIGAGAKVIGKAVLPKSENIMNRVVRLTPTDANKFEKIAGKKHGQYLTETGNMSAPEKVAEKEATKFVNSLKEVDDALATLPGNYKTGAVDDMLDELVARESRVSSPNVPSKDSARANFLSSKHKTVGLNMSEINEAKRLFERNVKLGYNKLLESDKVARATEIDNAVREWQFKKADDLGLKNLREINKQTQISKFLVDKIGKQITGRSGNDAVNLTDWIILSGGDPTAVSAFLVKKTLSNKNVQAGVAKLLAPRPFKKPVTAQFGGKSGLPAKIEGIDYSLPKQNPPKYQPIKLPESARETNLGLDEVKAIRSKPALQLPAKTQVEKAYTKTIPEKKPKPKLSIKNSQAGFIATGYKGESDLTTKILKDLEGKTTVSKQYILDATNRGELKQVERDLIRRILDESSEATPNISELTKNPIYKNFTQDIIGNSKVGRENLLNAPDSSRYMWRAANDSSVLLQNADLPDNAFKSIVGKTREDVISSLNKNIDTYKVEKTQLPPKDLKKISQVEDFVNTIKSELTGTKKSSDTINVSDFAKKVKAELLPLKRVTQKSVKYENIDLPDELKMPTDKYEEHIYESPIKTSAGKVHGFNTEYYSGHTRTRDLADKKTRQILEIQDDLRQKGNLEKEVNNYGTDFTKAEARYRENNGIKPDKKLTDLDNERITELVKQNQNVLKLSQYDNRTSPFRMVREEIKKAAQDGKTKLQFPTGETAMKIEGLGENTSWTRASTYATNNRIPLDKTDMKVGLEIKDGNSDWIITDLLGDGKFKAVPKDNIDLAEDQLVALGYNFQDDAIKAIADGDRRVVDILNDGNAAETFDISGKVDTNNPIYKFYEKDVQKYLNKFGGKRIVDDKGVSWIEVPIKKEYGKAPVEAFGKSTPNVLLWGAGIGLAGAVGAGKIKKLGKKPPKLK